MSENIILSTATVIEALNKLEFIGNNHRVIRYPLNGTWIDIGQQADLAKARELVKHLNNK